MSKTGSKYTIDMLNGPMWKKALIFSLPLAATSILQQLFNSADVAVVGRFAGSDALAAVGANVANVGVFVNFLVGFSVGPNVLFANHIGRGRESECPKTVGTTISLSLFLGLLCMLIGELLARPVLTFLQTPANVLDEAVLYLQIYLLGMPFMAIYNCAAALLRSVGDTKRPLFCLLISGFVNVALNLLFVIKFNKGVAGVSIATVISNVISCIIVLVILLREKGNLHLDLKKLRPDIHYAKRIIQLGVPAGVQNMVFSISNMFIQSGINSFGSNAIAGSSAALNFEYYTYYMVAAFGQATVTFTSQNYGAGKIDRVKRIFWITLWESMACTAILCAIFFILRDKVILVYTTDPAVIEFALKRMMCVASLEFLTGLYDVSCGSLRGLGKALTPSVLTILGTVGFRILWLYTIFKYFATFESLMIVYPVSWIVTAVMTITAYRITIRKIEHKWSVSKSV